VVLYDDPSSRIRRTGDIFLRPKWYVAVVASTLGENLSISGSAQCCVTHCLSSETSWRVVTVTVLILTWTCTRLTK
jgi:hypothetical protein